MTTAKKQTVSPAAETEGFKAPGGGLRSSIRDRIAAVAPYTAEIVTIPEWDNVEIEVRSLSLGERNDMLAKADGALEMTALYPEMVIRCSFDPESGEKVFGDDDIEFINTRPSNLIDRLALPAMKLSGLGENALDEEAKKSSPTESDE